MKFEISNAERDAANAFMEEHTECKDTSAIGGQWAYTFIGTSLGPIFKLRCTLCGTEKDCTEYESW